MANVSKLVLELSPFKRTQENAGHQTENLPDADQMHYVLCHECRFPCKYIYFSLFIRVLYVYNHNNFTSVLPKII